MPASILLENIPRPKVQLGIAGVRSFGITATHGYAIIEKALDYQHLPKLTIEMERPTPILKFRNTEIWRPPTEKYFSHRQLVWHHWSWCTGYHWNHTLLPFAKVLTGTGVIYTYISGKSSAALEKMLNIYGNLFFPKVFRKVTTLLPMQRIQRILDELLPTIQLLTLKILIRMQSRNSRRITTFVRGSNSSNLLTIYRAGLSVPRNGKDAFQIPFQCSCQLLHLRRDIKGNVKFGVGGHE